MSAMKTTHIILTSYKLEDKKMLSLSDQFTVAMTNDAINSLPNSKCRW